MIFVTVGTHEQPFNRLLKYVDQYISETGTEEKIICQSGYSTYTPKNFKAEPFIKHEDMEKYIEESNIVITHGGPSSFIPALIKNKKVIIVPREKEYNEHVNNHQVRFCEKINAEQAIVVTRNYATFKKTIQNYQDGSIVHQFKTNNSVFCSNLENLMNDSAEVGILSMQRIKNYGSFLQAYALKKIIEDLGHQVVFVDYHISSPLIKENSSKFSKIRSLLGSKISFKQKLQYILHKRNFSKKYNKILGLTKKPNYNPHLRTLVIGSDEVFNCIQTNKNVGYSLELFGKNNQANKVITYAASFGNTTIQKINKFNKGAELAEYINTFSSISIRDKNSHDIIQSLTNQEPFSHLDPVLIFDYMKRKEVPEIHTAKRYMIVYAYSGRITEEESSIIESYAKSKNLEVYAIGGAQSCADKFLNCTPFEVLAYFKQAECIVTDTFHGSIFSIINNRPFATIVRQSTETAYGNEEKLTDLLSKLQLRDHLVYDKKDIIRTLSKQPNFEQTNRIISNERVRTLTYLRENL